MGGGRVDREFVKNARSRTGGRPDRVRQTATRHSPALRATLTLTHYSNSYCRRRQPPTRRVGGAVSHVARRYSFCSVLCVALRVPQCQRVPYGIAIAAPRYFGALRNIIRTVSVSCSPLLDGELKGVPYAEAYGSSLKAIRAFPNLWRLRGYRQACYKVVSARAMLRRTVRSTLVSIQCKLAVDAGFRI